MLETNFEKIMPIHTTGILVCGAMVRYYGRRRVGLKVEEWKRKFVCEGEREERSREDKFRNISD